MRVGHTAAKQLLIGFTFRQHVFCCEDQREMSNLKRLYAEYDVRPTRMQLSEGMERLVLEVDGKSPFPESLTSLLLGPLPSSPRLADNVPNVLVDGWNNPDGPCQLQAGPRSDEYYKSVLESTASDADEPFGQVWESFSRYLAPGLLPQGLPSIQFAYLYGIPLSPRSIPWPVEQLQVGRFNRSLVGLLPSSLTQISLSEFDQPLMPAVLPASLQYLSLRVWDKPLQFSVLPASLKQLFIPSFNHPLHPGVLPLGLEKLSLYRFDQKLVVGSLPPSLAVLDMGAMFTKPLPAGRQQRDRLSANR